MNTLYNDLSFINPHCNIFNNLNFLDNNIINNRANFENMFIYTDNCNYIYNNIKNRYFNSILSPHNDKYI